MIPILLEESSTRLATNALEPASYLERERLLQQLKTQLKLTRKDTPKPLNRNPITYTANGGTAASSENPTKATVDAAGAV
ncbi:hypothetical protein TRAPUB_973 [Trametes pubescens]|uniref:Uncharacterized protein n=1 Tax=Trametes pubescens TaxID=154538 RepID=A0A1M2VKM1_TRAPU|nr:hypothetical protein TRAPUB_973 [Trametes pubescens]